MVTSLERKSSHEHKRGYYSIVKELYPRCCGTFFCLRCCGIYHLGSRYRPFSSYPLSGAGGPLLPSRTRHRPAACPCFSGAVRKGWSACRLCAPAYLLPGITEPADGGGPFQHFVSRTSRPPLTITVTHYSKA